MLKTTVKVTSIGGVALSVIAAAQFAFTEPWEDTVYKPYRDVGGVWTVCTGHTGPDIITSKTYTPAECEALFHADMLVKVDIPLSRCVKNQNLPKEVVIALRDFTFNVGGGASCNSTLVKLLNQGKIREACNQFSRWVFVKGVFIKGLENRRVNGLFGMVSERAMCLAGLK